MFIKLDYEPEDVCNILNNYNADLYDDVNVDYSLSGIIRLDKIDFGFLEQKYNTRYIDVKASFINDNNDLEITFSGFDNLYYFVLILMFFEYFLMILAFFNVFEMNHFFYFVCICHGLFILIIFKLSFIFGVSKYKTFLIRKLGEEIK